MAEQYPHLKLSGPDEITQYTSTGGRSKTALPTRNRQFHGEYLKACLQTAWDDSMNEFVTFHSERNGIYLEFQSTPGFEMAIKSLEDLKQGIRLCNVRTVKQSDQETETDIDEITFATVFIPKNKRKIFFDKVEKYLNEETEKGNPKNANLLESINELRKALLIESFWVDDKNLIPEEKPQWCEVWLRGDDEEVLFRVDQLLATHNINSKTGYIRFPERTVKLVCVSQFQMENITRNSDDIAEYRRAKDTAEFLLSQRPVEQAEWVNDLIGRLTIDKQSQIAICILDTGVNNGHPLIKPVLAETDCQSVQSNWGNHDHNGHGTLMAGLSAYGDLQSRLEDSETVRLNHFLESVKILPPTRQNDPELWGEITAQAISLAEIKSPDRKRISCMAITAKDMRDQGRPSSWSGAIDQITSGADNSEKRLLLVSAGNVTDFNQIANYPDLQTTDSIHDPAQAWNVLTIGAFTKLTELTDTNLSDYSPVAQRNQLSPFSTTSMTWEDKWPIKPEVVFEGGNVAVDSSGFTTECDDLRLISTFHKPHEKLLEAFSMTSAATAQAAHFAAQIQSRYPDYWPETIRALMVHSAKWPEALKNQFADNNNKNELKKVLRACGYGVPCLDLALYCASNSLTLIAETEIQPFEKDGSEYKTKDMHLYNLPWPTSELQDLGETEVEMKITLSYFVEPGPGEVGWRDRYRYPSHALRFDLNSPTESQDEFVRRINKSAQDEENGKPDRPSASKYWVIGQARDKGSIHSDIWHGTASDLASSNLIAVSPKIGWWRERHHLHKYNNKTRYSLIVSIKTPGQSVDIYTPVATQIAQPLTISIVSESK